MAEPLKSGDRTATEIQQEQLSKPVGKRNTELMRSVAEAQVDTNLMNYNIKKAGKEAGLATNNLQAEPVFDVQGNIKGYKVK